MQKLEAKMNGLLAWGPIEVMCDGKSHVISSVKRLQWLLQTHGSIVMHTTDVAHHIVVDKGTTTWYEHDARTMEIINVYEF